MPGKYFQYYIASKLRVKNKSLTLKPGKGKAVGLGVYNADTPMPKFKISFQPNIKDDIGVTHEKIQTPGDSTYQLMYQFHNFSSQACKIKLQLL